MRTFRQLRGIGLAAACDVLAGLALAGSAAAQARLDARYVATLAGLPIGEGSWLITVEEADYSATATGTTTGLMRAFTGGYGQTITRGSLKAGLAYVAIAATVWRRVAAMPRHRHNTTCSSWTWSVGSRVIRTRNCPIRLNAPMR